jgi:hypothetical protein
MNYFNQEPRQALIDHYYPELSASDFLSREFDEAILGVTFFPGQGTRINYDYARALDIDKDLRKQRGYHVMTEAATKKVTFSTNVRDVPNEEIFPEEEHVPCEQEKIAEEILGNSPMDDSGKDYMAEGGR